MNKTGLYLAILAPIAFSACGGKSMKADDDIDGDGVSNHADNCPATRNRSQRDTDQDRVGDACDLDEVSAEVEIPPVEIPTVTVEVDDADNDGYETESDNCPSDWNPDQDDLDGDGYGDVCDEDDDDDSWLDPVDNCIADYNPYQEDLDGDGYGDVCDNTDDREQCPTELPLNECDNGYGWAYCEEQPIEDIPRSVVIQGTTTVALYWYASNGLRYVFPNQSVYDSWFQPGVSCPMIFQVSDEDLAEMMIGGNITVRPGTHLIKITTDPKVYAVECGGIIRWFEREALIEEIYGPFWNTYVLDIADAFFADYEAGPTITSAADYDPDAVFASTETPDDELACR